MDLISGLLVVTDPARRALARAAINRFLLQDYPEKELVVINGTGAAFLDEPHDAIREVLFDFHVNPPLLGTLRNLSLEHARGSWCVTWDDDDWSDPSRLSIQAAARFSGRPSVLAAQIRIDLRDGTACVYEAPSGLAPTMLFPAGPGRYPPLGRGEQVDFAMHHHPERNILASPLVSPAISIACYHGRNVLSRDVFLGEFAAEYCRGRWALPRFEREVLERVLEELGFLVTLKEP